MDERLLYIFKGEQLWWHPYVTLLEKEAPLILCNEDPKSDIKFPLVNQQRFFNIFLNNEYLRFDFVGLTLVRLLIILFKVLYLFIRWLSSLFIWLDLPTHIMDEKVHFLPRELLHKFFELF
jgi:hypothetical protein